MRQIQTTRVLSARRAFTLVELLVVIAIIILLVGILAPAVMSAIRVANAAKTQTRITELQQACDSFHQDHDQFYPGQINTDELAGEGGNYTGSQILAGELFGYVDVDDTGTYGNINDANPAVEPHYAKCTLADEARNSDLFDPTDIHPEYADNDRRNSISDRFGARPMAILYYPSRPAADGYGQYEKADNEDYLTDTTFEEWTGQEGATGFNNYIDHPDIDGNVPYQDGRFILIGAGVDRLYGTGDDLTNIPGKNN